MVVSILNPYAILLGAVVHILLGMLWYHPKLFGKAWGRHVGIKKKDLKKKMPRRTILISIVAALLIATILSFLATVFERTLLGGFLTGFLAWAGFVATTTINPVLWERKDPHIYFINNAYYLFSFIIMGIIIGVWA